MSSQAAMRAEWEALNKKTEGLVENTAPTGEEVYQENSVPEVLEKENTAPEETQLQEQSQEKVEPVKSVESVVESRPKQDSYNFRQLREQNRELERKLYELENKLKTPEKVEEVEDYELKDDDLTEGKHYKALKNQVRKLNEALQREKVERDKIAAEARLRASYPDIFNVVNEDNMKALAEQEPEFVQSILSSPNQYAQYVAAYKQIKRLGIGTQDPYAETKERAQKNLAKPKSAATVSPRQGESALSEVDRFSRGMTPELQSQLLREMEDAIANR